jgi:SAM-dependent methyltransferase
MRQRAHKKEWFDNESLWRELYPFIFSPKRFADASKEIIRTLALAKPRGKAILDLACGPGRCAIPLARRGFKVTGVDSSRFLLDKARAAARRIRARVEWIHADMRDFIRPGAFDLVLSMFSSFGYFDNKQEDLHVLENMWMNLRPGGKCFIEMAGKEFLAQHLNRPKHELLKDRVKCTRLVCFEDICDDWSRLRAEWILIRDGRAKTFQLHLTIYSGQELKDRLAKAGFVNVKLFGNFDGDEYGPSTKRLIAIAEKPLKRFAVASV